MPQPRSPGSRAFSKTAAERNVLLQAHRDARDDTLRYIEEEIAFTTLGRGGKGGFERARMAWVRIDHFTSRPKVTVKRVDPETGAMGTELHTLNPRMPGDPQIHSHNIVPNVVVTESGRVAAIPHRLMAGRVHEFGGFYQARLVRRLRDAGIAAELCPTTKMAKLPGIPDEVCEEFSKRTRDANEAARTAAAERGLDCDTMDPDAKVKFLKAGAKASRKYKTDDLSNFKAWFGQAAAIGWQHNTVVAPPLPCRRTASAPPMRPPSPCSRRNSTRRSLSACRLSGCRLSAG